MYLTALIPAVLMLAQVATSLPTVAKGTLTPLLLDPSDS